MTDAEFIAFQELARTMNAATEAFGNLTRLSNPSDFERKNERDWPDEKVFRLERLNEERAKLDVLNKRLARAWALYVERDYSNTVTTLMGTGDEA